MATLSDLPRHPIADVQAIPKLMTPRPWWLWFVDIRSFLNAVSSSGFVMVTASPSVVPDGWLVCDGSAVSRSTYSSLFAAIGTTYGPGDGSTTFNLPDTTGAWPIADFVGLIRE